jgi:hypothetical protein
LFRPWLHTWGPVVVPEATNGSNLFLRKFAIPDSSLHDALYSLPAGIFKPWILWKKVKRCLC